MTEKEKNNLYYMQISCDHIAMTEWLTDEQRGILFRLIFDYFLEKKDMQEIIEEVKNEDKIILPILANIKTSIDRSKEAYAEKCRQNSKNGKKGGAPKGNQNARKKKDEDEEDEETNLTNLDDEEIEELMDFQNQNSTLAYNYYCLSEELEEQKFCFSMFFDFKQLLKFISLISFLKIVFQIPKMSFYSFFENGVNGFIDEIESSQNTNEFLDDFEQSYKDMFINELCEQEPKMNTEEAERCFNSCADLCYTAENILYSISSKDDDLQAILNK